VIRRLPTSEIHLNRRYRYFEHATLKPREGTLLTAGGGWYKFDTGTARGADNVVEEIGSGSSSSSSSSGSSAPAAAAASRTGMSEDRDERKVGEAESSSDATSGDEMDEEPDADVSLAGQLLAVAGRFGLTDDTVISVVIEMTRKDLDLYSTSRPLMRDLLSEPRFIASCMKTADNLVALFSGGASVAAGAATRGNQKSMTTTAANLCTAIEQNAATGCIARITYGIHGFVVVVTDGKAELLQSFASGKEPETLAWHCKNPRRFSVSGVCDVLKQMAGTTKAGRKEGQSAISGDPDYEPETVLEDASNTFPDVAFTWSVHPIPAIPVILERVRAQIEANLKVVGRHLKK